MSKPPVLRSLSLAARDVGSVGGSGELPATRPPERKSSGIRPIVRPPLEDEWLDRQLLLAANLVHLRARAEARAKGAEDAGLRLVHRLEALEDPPVDGGHRPLPPPLPPMRGPP